MIKIDEVVYAIRTWLRQNDVSADSLHVILNFADPRAAANFDYALKREVHYGLQFTDVNSNLGDHMFELMGIKFKIESPLHSEPSRR